MDGDHRLDGDHRSGIKSGMTFILHLFKNSKFEMSQNEWNNKTPVTTSIIRSASSATRNTDPSKLILPIVKKCEFYALESPLSCRLLNFDDEMN